VPLVWVAGPARSVQQVDAGLLLDHMGELMGEEPASGFRVRRVFADAEDDVRMDREGPRGQRRRGLGGFRIRVHPHAAEVVAELASGGCSGGRFKGLTARSEDLANTEHGRPAFLRSGVLLILLCENPQGEFPSIRPA
jgi:hypothetical protein